MLVICMGSFLPMMLILLVRFNPFSTGQFAENTFACTKNVLLLHTNRASDQCRIWESALQPVMSPPSFSEFGWEVIEGQVNIRRMTLPAAPDGNLENVDCGCGSGCSTRRCAWCNPTSSVETDGWNRWWERMETLPKIPDWYPKNILMRWMERTS